MLCFRNLGISDVRWTWQKMCYVIRTKSRRVRYNCKGKLKISKGRLKQWNLGEDGWAAGYISSIWYYVTLGVHLLSAFHQSSRFQALALNIEQVCTSGHQLIYKRCIMSERLIRDLWPVEIRVWLSETPEGGGEGAAEAGNVVDEKALKAEDWID